MPGVNKSFVTFSPTHTPEKRMLALLVTISLLSRVQTRPVSNLTAVLPEHRQREARVFPWTPGAVETAEHGAVQGKAAEPTRGRRDLGPLCAKMPEVQGSLWAAEREAGASCHP